MSQFDPSSLLSALSRIEAKREPSNNPDKLKRRFQRFVVRSEALLYPTDGHASKLEPIQIMLRDVNVGGVGFVCQRELPINSVWRLAVLDAHGATLALPTIAVRHCEHIQGNAWLVGSMSCFDAGLLHALGVDPTQAMDIDSGTDEVVADSFMPPGQVA